MKILELIPSAHYDIQRSLAGAQNKETFLRQINGVFHFEQQKSSLVPHLIIFFDVAAQYYVSGISFI